jgi:hypothetical protein
MAGSLSGTLIGIAKILKFLNFRMISEIQERLAQN